MFLFFCHFNPLHCSCRTLHSPFSGLHTKMTLGDVEESEVAGDSTTEKIPVKHTLEYKFCVNTSCHGLRNVIEAKRIWVRCFWATAVVVAFGVFLQQTIVLVMQYTEFEAVSEVRINVNSQFLFTANYRSREYYSNFI